MGSDGAEWIEPLRDVVCWDRLGLEMKSDIERAYGVVSKRVQSEQRYMVPGVAFSMIGSQFAARAHRYRSVFGNKGASVFPADIAQTLVAMNSSAARLVLESLNPGIGFEVGDVNRLAIFPVESADAIFATLDRAFTEHEAAREASVEFQRPGPSPWRTAQEWAQRAVDRAAGEPLPPYEPGVDPPAPEAALSFAFGLAIGRFPLAPDGEGSPPGGEDRLREGKDRLRGGKDRLREGKDWLGRGGDRLRRASRPSRSPAASSSSRPRAASTTASRTRPAGRCTRRGRRAPPA